jgi:hypothetical protein
MNIVTQIAELLRILLLTENMELLAPDDAGLYKKSLDKLIIYVFFWSVQTAVTQNAFGRFERMLWDQFHLEPMRISLSNFVLILNKHGSEFNRWDM